MCRQFLMITMSSCVYKLPTNLSNNDILNMLTAVSRKDDSLSLSIEERRIILSIIYELKRGYVNPSLIIDEWLKIEGIKPPLQLLWALDIEDLLKFTTYLYFNKEYCSTLSAIISTVSLNDHECTAELRKILIFMFGVILNVKNCTYFQMLGKTVLDNTISMVLESFEMNRPLKWQYLSDLKKSPIISLDLLNNFILDHIKAFLSHENHSLDLMYALSNHIKLWVCGKMSGELKAFIDEMLSELDPQTIINVLSNAVEMENFNWKYLLSITSVFIQKQKNSELMKGLVDEWIKNSFEDKNKNLLLISLIVARHCCAEKARYFNNYPTWFNSLNLKSVPVFTFFFECLTQIVPNEPPLFLKIHINKVPAVPASCRKNLTDYITLCKTRLADLNETTDYIGIFNDYYETDEEGQEADISRALSIFQDTNEIPKPLLEASVFRKQYYEKVFLKRLLSVPESSDAKRADLIKKLHSAGKISNSLFNRWSSLADNEL